MADFAESFHVAQLDADSYKYCWTQVDLADETFSAIEQKVCSGEELFDALENHGFDTDRVFNHFEDYPLSSICLRDEY